MGTTLAPSMRSPAWASNEVVPLKVSNVPDLRFPLPAELLELSLADMAARLEALPEAPELGSLKTRVEALRIELESLVARPAQSTQDASQLVTDVLAVEAEIAKMWVDEGRPAFTTTIWRARGYTTRAS
jgi:hypothetical protein